MEHLDPKGGAIVDVRNAQASAPIVFVCEHASAHIPEAFGDLGLSDAARDSHIAWDPGALALAERLAARFDAALVAAKTSRLVYDCNRPPEAHDAIPARSEIYDIPGNAGLSRAERAERVARYYTPFRAALAGVLAASSAPSLVTVHSFTPVYDGQAREVEIGVLHDSDSRLADAVLDAAVGARGHVVRRNEPYGPGDGVTHTLREHALPAGHLNVMLEVRSDLISDTPGLDAMADTLSAWLENALASRGAAAC